MLAIEVAVLDNSRGIARQGNNESYMVQLKIETLWKWRFLKLERILSKKTCWTLEFYQFYPKWWGHQETNHHQPPANHLGLPDRCNSIRYKMAFHVQCHCESSVRWDVSRLFFCWWRETQLGTNNDWLDDLVIQCCCCCCWWWWWWWWWCFVDPRCEISQCNSVNCEVRSANGFYRGWLRHQGMSVVGRFSNAWTGHDHVSWQSSRYIEDHIYISFFPSSWTIRGICWTVFFCC